MACRHRPGTPSPRRGVLLKSYYQWKFSDGSQVVAGAAQPGLQNHGAAAGYRESVGKHSVFNTAQSHERSSFARRRIQELHKRIRTGVARDVVDTFGARNESRFTHTWDELSRLATGEWHCHQRPAFFVGGLIEQVLAGRPSREFWAELQTRLERSKAVPAAREPLEGLVEAIESLVKALDSSTDPRAALDGADADRAAAAEIPTADSNNGYIVHRFDTDRGDLKRCGFVLAGACRRLLHRGARRPLRSAQFACANRRTLGRAGIVRRRCRRSRLSSGGWDDPCRGGARARRSR